MSPAVGEEASVGFSGVVGRAPRRVQLWQSLQEGGRKSALVLCFLFQEEELHREGKT